jgi:hypothetical protein
MYRTYGLLICSDHCLPALIKPKMRKRSLGGLTIALLALIMLVGVHWTAAAASLESEDNPKIIGWPSASIPNPSNAEGAHECGREAVHVASAICDPDGLLTADTKDKLEEVVDAARKDVFIPAPKIGKMALRSIQVGVLVINKIRRDAGGKVPSSKDFAKQVHDRWGVGDAEAGTGVLLFISKTDREIFISTGAAARDRLTDAECEKVILTMIPLLRDERFDLAVQAIFFCFPAAFLLLSCCFNDTDLLLIY